MSSTPVLFPILLSILLVPFLFVHWIETKECPCYMMRSLLCATITFILWLLSMSMESKKGLHTNLVKDMLKTSICLFIFSEVMFFAGWFWAWFHFSLSPLTEEWSPVGIEPMKMEGIPLLNTVILLSASVTATISHNKVIENKSGDLSLVVTIYLSLFFLLVQLEEYNITPFSISDSVFGSIFFTTTGFHMIHVTLGMYFFMGIHWMISNYTIKKGMIVSTTPYHHLSLEFSVWYFHFVDVVWLFLFYFFYVYPM